MHPRVAIPLAAAVGAAVGFGAGFQLARPPAPIPSTAEIPAAPAPPLGAVASPPATPVPSELEQERRARIELEQEVARLRERGGDEGTLAAGTEDVADEGEARGVFDEGELLQGGFLPHEITRLKERFEAFELELLYLQDQARREGWGGPRLQDERQGLRQEMRNELGDDDYDAMLYAAGRKNRVVVAGVLANSPAETAGLRKGDAILQYGEARIFDLHALVGATRTGEAGVLTEIRFERDGTVRRVFLPRGPIGVRLGRERRLPDLHG